MLIEGPSIAAALEEIVGSIDAKGIEVSKAATFEVVKINPGGDNLEVGLAVHKVQGNSVGKEKNID